MRALGLLIFAVLALLSLLSIRRAYVAFIVFGVLYFPAKVGFRLEPRACDVEIDTALALFSLTNWAHILLFAFFFLMTIAQFQKRDRAAFAWAAAATIAMGIFVELAEGITGTGHCRLRDLVSDAAGALLGSALVTVAAAVRSRFDRRASHER